MRKHRQWRNLHKRWKLWWVTRRGVTLGKYHTEITRDRMIDVYERMIFNDEEGA